MSAQLLSVPRKSKVTGETLAKFSRFGTNDLRELNERTDKKLGRQSLYIASYLSAKWSPFWAIDGGYKVRCRVGNLPSK
eukprot:5782386-Pleurochrysis_carterae.AAC.1